MEKVIFGAGCFWGVEAAFRQTPGVLEAVVGYSGGHTANPTYEDVCTGQTGHAEVVEVTFDPDIIAFDRLLQVCWDCHDPTQHHRQGPDVGSQYRSAIFTTSPEQKLQAEASRDRLQTSESYRNRPIVTEIAPASTFYRAEEYHQRYLEKRGRIQCH